MAFKQEVNVPLIFTIGVVSGIMLLVIVIGTQAWYQSEEQNEIALKRAGSVGAGAERGFADGYARAAHARAVGEPCGQAALGG